MKRGLTKIQDHPRRPAVPLMNEIPYAKIPENAPAMEAAPKNMPTRNCSMARGYQRVRLVAHDKWAKTGKDEQSDKDLLVDYAWE